MPSEITVTCIGACFVPMKTTVHEKDHFTVTYTHSKADGTKLKPFVVFKGKGTQLMRKWLGYVVIYFSKNCWVNDGLTVEYLNSLIGAFSFYKRLLAWDAYKCHTNELFQRHMTSLHLHTAVVLGGCTKFIQAADVVAMECFV